MNEFKDRLTKIRKERGLTQTKVADYLGIAQASYIRYEKGTSEPTVVNLVKICDLLDVPADFLLGRENFIENKIAKLYSFESK